MSRHSPGPWKLHFWSENIGIATDRKKPRDCETVGTVARMAENGPFHEDVLRAEANARLMAAAPDLLAALKEARLFVRIASERGSEDAWTMLPRIESAIEKAEEG